MSLNDGVFGLVNAFPEYSKKNNQTKHNNYPYNASTLIKTGDRTRRLIKKAKGNQTKIPVVPPYRGKYASIIMNSMDQAYWPYTANTKHILNKPKIE